MKKKLVSILLCTAMVMTMAAGCGSGGSDDKSADSSGGSGGDGDYSGTTVSILIDTDTTDAGLKAVCELATEKLGMDFNIEYRVGGADGDNLVKTRLSSGDMADF